MLRGVGSPTRALRLGGFVAAGSHRIIRALAAPRAVADQLGVDESVALLRIRSVTWDADRVPFDCYETWLRSDRVPLELSTSVHRPALTSIA